MTLSCISIWAGMSEPILGPGTGAVVLGRALGQVSYHDSLLSSLHPVWAESSLQLAHDSMGLGQFYNAHHNNNYSNLIAEGLDNNYGPSIAT